MNKFIVLGFLILALLSLIGCATVEEQPVVVEEMPTDPPPQEDEAAAPEEEAPAIEPEVIDEPPAEALTTPEEPSEEEPVETETQETDTEEQTAEGEVEEYVPTQETYDRTFSEVEETIGKLNEIIRNRDFEEWKSYLTDHYRRAMSSPEMLSELSDHRILKRNNIVLKSLEDYFTFVVVPSRANARLDDLVFRTDDRVQAIMIIQGQRVILYQLQKVNDAWKIALF